jgi:hypothetical protein
MGHSADLSRPGGAVKLLPLLAHGPGPSWSYQNAHEHPVKQWKQQVNVLQKYNINYYHLLLRKFKMLIYRQSQFTFLWALAHVLPSLNLVCLKHVSYNLRKTQ